MIGAGVIGAALLIKLVLFPGKSVPAEFTEARLRGSGLAQAIVSLSGDSLKSLDQIAKYDRQYNTSEALLLISKELMRNREISQSALRLSSELERMARAIPYIRPAAARNSVATAVSLEVALVSRLFTYNDYFRQLFEILQIRFSRPWEYASGKEVAFLIAKINEEAKSINELDRQFNETIAEFDRIVNQ